MDNGGSIFINMLTLCFTIHPYLMNNSSIVYLAAYTNYMFQYLVQVQVKLRIQLVFDARVVIFISLKT